MERILVTGATGTTGSEVARLLVGQGAAVRALVRDPARAAGLAAQGVEVVQGDLARAETLDAALDGVSRVFLCTSPAPEQVEVQGNLIGAAAARGVRYVVRISVAGASHDSAMALMRWHAAIEDALAASGVAYTNLRPGMFMQNFLASAATIKSNGVFFGCAGKQASAMVDARDLAASAAALLTAPEAGERTYAITGPRVVAMEEAAAAFHKALGREVHYVDLPPAAFRDGLIGAGMPEWLASDLVEMQKRFVTLGGEVSDAVRALTGRPPRDIEQFAMDFADWFR